mmetsp:Transcript_1901/g.4367  ORF Transcript_1901/g.4367 Transcript_1901/m.4367 type:complete len:922 (-) Transcript_1901:139-2904(-)
MAGQEVLSDNVFFNHVVSRHKALFKSLFDDENAMLCVPSSATVRSLGKRMKSKEFIRHHMIKLAEDCDNTGKASVTRLTSFAGGHLDYDSENKTLTTGQGFPFRTTVRIIYEENYYTEDFQSVKILHVSKPLHQAQKEDADSALLEAIRAVKVKNRKLGEHNSLIHLLLGPDSVRRLAKRLEEFSTQLKTAYRTGVGLTLDEAAYRIETATKNLLVSEEKLLKRPLDSEIRSELLVAILAVFLEYKPLTAHIFQSHLRQYPMENQRIEMCIRQLKDLSMSDVGVPESLQFEAKDAISLMQKLNSTETAMAKIVLIQDVVQCLVDTVGKEIRDEVTRMSQKKGKVQKDRGQIVYERQRSEKLLDMLLGSTRTEGSDPEENCNFESRSNNADVKIEREGSTERVSIGTRVWNRANISEPPVAPNEPPPEPPKMNDEMKDKNNMGSEKRQPNTDSKTSNQQGVPPSHAPTSKAEQKALSTDDILPLLVYVLIKANPLHLYTNVCYMQALRPGPSILPDANHLDFTMANLTAALEYIASAPTPESHRPGSPSSDSTQEYGSVGSHGSSFVKPPPIGEVKEENGTGNDRLENENKETETPVSGSRKKPTRSDSKQTTQSVRSISPARRRSFFPSPGEENLRREDRKRRARDSRRASFTLGTPMRQSRPAGTHMDEHASHMLGAGHSSSIDGDEGRILMEGYMKKRGWLAPTFRLRYFVFHLPSPTGHKVPYLNYYRTKGHGKKRGTIFLTEGGISFLQSKTDNRTFMLSFLKDRRTVVLRAPTVEHAKKWVKLLMTFMSSAAQNLIKALQSRMETFDITLHEYEKVLERIADISPQEISQMSERAKPLDFLNRITEDTKRKEAKILERWVTDTANDGRSAKPDEQVATLEEIAEVLGKNLANGKIAQGDYDALVKRASETMFSLER